jgi:hypothetical protein
VRRHIAGPLMAVGLAIGVLTGLPALAYPGLSVAQLDFLAGHWRGADFEAFYLKPAAGTLFSVSRQLSGGRVVFFEWDSFRQESGTIRLLPYPGGTLKETFMLEHFRPSPPLAVFGNPTVAFPRTITYERPKPDRLLITVAGTQGGDPVSERYDLHRIP